MSRKNLFLLLLLSFFSTCCSSYSEEEESMICVQIKDHSGRSETFNEKNRMEKFTHIDFQSPQPYKQVLRVFQEKRDEQNRSILTSYHANGQIKQYLEGVGTTAKGKYTEWHPNGQKKIVSTVIGGIFDLHYDAQKHWLFDGTSSVWSEKGTLLADIQYHLGYLQGISKYYYKKGTLKTQIPYEKNQIHGEMCKYYPNGTLKEKAYYQEGKKQGPSIGYWENESPSFLEEYDKGALLTGLYMDQNGKELASVNEGFGFQALFSGEYLDTLVEYKNGFPEGRVTKLTKNGEKLGEYSQKKGKKHGKEKMYFEKRELAKPSKDPVLKLLVDWDDDTIHGSVKTWYSNGKLESQKEYSRNKRNGVVCAWYNEGSLMFLEEYENDLLVEGSYYKMHSEKPISKVHKGKGLATIYDGETGAFLRKISYDSGKPLD